MSLFSSIGAALGVLNPVGLLGTAGVMGGSILDYFGQQDTNRTNADIAAATNARASIDTQATNASNRAIADQANAMERDFAQNGISWRIADAAKNGISPLAALGASEPSASPAMPVMQSAPLVTPSYRSPLSSAAAGIPELSQNISRSLMSMQTPAQKANDALELARKSKENDLLDVQLANAKLSLIQHSQPPGLPLAYRDVLNKDGSVSTVPTHGGEFFGPALWSIDNKLMPSYQQLPTVMWNLSHGSVGTEWSPDSNYP